MAFAGLALVADDGRRQRGDAAGFLLLVGAAACWATGNVLLRRAGQGRHAAADLLAESGRRSLPLFALSLAFEGPARIAAAVSGATWLTVGAVLYIALVSTIFGYAVWGHLLKLYPAATAAPFSLLVPVSGTLFGAR